MSRNFAAIDVGTNSINLLITDADGSVILREGHTERLGERLHQDGILTEEAMNRAVQRIRKYQSIIEDNDVASWKVVVTAPGRLANNAADFLGMLRAEVGDRVEVATGEREAELSFHGAASGDPFATKCMIDIGGGSTEFAFGIGNEFSSVSIPLGAVTITAKHLHSDPPRPEELTNAIGDVNDHLDDVLRAMPNVASAHEYVGVAGTMVTVAAVEIGLHEFDAGQLQGFALTREAAEEVFRTLATESLAERKLNPGLPPERADVIVGGCCVVVAFMRRLNLTSITVSVRNLLDGVINELRLPQ